MLNSILSIPIISSWSLFVPQKTDRLEELRGYIDKHKGHIKSLETIMRMVDNDALEIDQVDQSE